MSSNIQIFEGHFEEIIFSNKKIEFVFREEGAKAVETDNYFEIIDTAGAVDFKLRIAGLKQLRYTDNKVFNDFYSKNIQNALREADKKGLLKKHTFFMAKNNYQKTENGYDSVTKIFIDSNNYLFPKKLKQMYKIEFGKYIQKINENEIDEYIDKINKPVEVKKDVPEEIKEIILDKINKNYEETRLGSNLYLLIPFSLKEKLNNLIYSNTVFADAMLNFVNKKTTELFKNYFGIKTPTVKTTNKDEKEAEKLLMDAFNSFIKTIEPEQKKYLKNLLYGKVIEDFETNQVAQNLDKIFENIMALRSNILAMKFSYNLILSKYEDLESKYAKNIFHVDLNNADFFKDFNFTLPVLQEINEEEFKKYTDFALKYNFDFFTYKDKIYMSNFIKKQFKVSAVRVYDFSDVNVVNNNVSVRFKNIMLNNQGIPAEFYYTGIQEELKQIENIKIKKSMFKFKDYLSFLTPLGEISPHQPFIEDPSVFKKKGSESVNLKSIYDLLSDPVSAQLLMISDKKSLFKEIAKKNNIDIMTKGILIKPSEGSKNIGDEFKTEKINKENLGMLEYGYLPNFDLRDEKDKKYFLEKLKEFLKEKNAIDKYAENNFKLLEETVKQADFLVLGIEEHYPKKVIKEQLFKPIFIDRELNQLSALNFSETLYKEFVEKSGIWKAEDFIKTPSLSSRHIFELVKSIAGTQYNFYKQLYKNNFAEMEKLSYSFLGKYNGITEVRGIENEKDKEALYKLSTYVYKELAGRDVFQKDINALVKTIKQSNIPPVEKNVLIRFFSEPLKIYERRDELNSILIDLQVNNADQEEEIKTIIEHILEKYETLIKAVKKETNSFIMIEKIKFNLIEIMKEKDERKRKEILKRAYKGFETWGIDIVGLSSEQFQDALNGAIMFLTNKDLKVINYAYSMGTGKTRLALFLMITLGAFNKEVYFAIQNKNKDDIYDQLKDMLPSFTYYTAQYFNQSADFANISSVPFNFVDDIYSNVFYSSNADIVLNSQDKTKKEVINGFFDEVKRINDKLKRVYLNDIKQLIEKKKYFSDFNQKFDEIYKNTIKQSVSLFDEIKEDSFLNYKYNIYRNYASIVFHINNLIESKNIDVEKGAVNKISNKLYADLEKIFNSLFTFIKDQKDKKINLIANSYYSNYPKKELKSVKINQDVFTYNKLKDLTVKTEQIPAQLDLMTINKFMQKFYHENYKADNNENAFLYFYERDLAFSNDNQSVFENGLKKIFELYEIKDTIFDLTYGYLKDNIDLQITKEICDFIKINGGAIEQYAFKNLSIKEDILNKIESEIKTFYPIEAEKVKKILTNLNAEFNKLYIASALTFANNPFLKNDLKAFFSIGGEAVKEIEIKAYFSNSFAKGINVEVKKSRNQIKNIEIHKLEDAFFEKINDDIKKDIEIAKLHSATFNIKGYKKNIELKFDKVPLNYVYTINLNSSFLYNLNTRGKFIITDEAHKNVLRNLNVNKSILENGGKIVGLTGTPVNGKSDSIVEKLAPELELEKMKEKSNIIVKKSGIIKITSSFIQSIIEFVKELKDVENPKEFIENKRAELEHIAYFEDRTSDVQEFIDYLKEREYKNVSEEDVYNKFVTSKDIKIAPGISNPHALSQVVETLPSETAIKDSKQRVWDIKNLKELSYGNKLLPQSGHYNNILERMMVNELIDIKIAFDVAQKMPHYHFVSLVKKMLNDVVESFVLSPNPETHLLYEFFKDKYTLEQLFKLITPKSATEKDTIGQIFFNRAFKINTHLDQPERVEFVNEMVKFVDYVMSNIANNEKLNNKSLEYWAIDKKAEYLNLRKRFDFLDDGWGLWDNNYKKEILTDITISLKEMFPKIMKEDVKFVINVYGRKYNEIKNELFNSVADMLNENMEQGVNSILFASRINLLILKIAETLNELMENNFEKPVYFLINVSSDKDFQNFVNGLDLEKLKQNNIYVIKSNTYSMYKDYNYLIPKHAHFTIASIYSSLAEGFRFPRVKEIIYTGLPSNIATLVQSMARAFAPKINEEVSIHITTPKLTPILAYQNKEVIKKDRSFSEKAIEMLESYIYKNGIGGIGNYYLNNIEDIAKFKLEKNELIDIEYGDKDFYENIKNITNSVVTSLKFMGSKIGNYEEKLPETLIVLSEKVNNEKIAKILNEDAESVKQSEKEKTAQQADTRVKIKK